MAPLAQGLLAVVNPPLHVRCEHLQSGYGNCCNCGYGLIAVHAKHMPLDPKHCIERKGLHWARVLALAGPGILYRRLH